MMGSLFLILGSRTGTRPLPGFHGKNFTGRYLILVFLLFLPLFFPGGSLAGPVHGGRLTVAVEADSWGFDAIKARALTVHGQITAYLVMERLFAKGADGELVPVLGLSAVESGDGRSWTVVLRQGVEFHDGEPFTAGAVVKHWARLLDPQNRYRGRLLIDVVESVVKTGEYEVCFNLKHAWLPFLDVLAATHSFTALIPSPAAVAAGTQDRSPVGTGPFVFKEWRTGDKITVVKNKNYWQKGKPYLDEVVVRDIPDSETLYSALVSGQVNLAFIDRPERYHGLKENPDFKVLVGKGGGTGILLINTTKPPLNDVRVRRALAHAWDQEAYIKACFGNIYPRAENLYDDILSCPDNGYLEHDPEKAKALLADYGRKVSLEYIHSPTVRGRQTGAMLQQMFKEAGVDLRPVPLDWSAIMQRILSRQFDLASWVVAQAADMGPTAVAFLASNNPVNWSGYKNEQVDELLKKQRLNTDPDARRRTLCQLARLVNENAVFLYLFDRRIMYGAHKKVHGVPPPDYVSLFLADAWLEP